MKEKESVLKDLSHHAQNNSDINKELFTRKQSLKYFKLNGNNLLQNCFDELVAHRNMKKDIG